MNLKIYILYLIINFGYTQEYGLPIETKFQGAEDSMNVPRGIFHYSMRETGIGSNFKVPDSDDFSAVQLGGKFRTKDSMVSFHL